MLPAVAESQALGGQVPFFDAARYCIPGEITITEVQDMKCAFDMIDEDRSGRIDAEEVQGAAVALGIPIEDNISVLLGANKIDFDEFFKRMTAKLTPDDKADDIMAIFEMYDFDQTGTISFENMQNIAKIIGAKESAQQIQEILTVLDTDGDNELDPMDFYTCCISGMRIRLDRENRAGQMQAEQLQAMEVQEGRAPPSRSQSGLGGSRTGLGGSGSRAQY